MMKIAVLILALVLTSAGPPIVTGNSPSSGSTVGAPKMIVTVTFDQPMSPGSINEQTFTLFNQNGAIPGQVFYSENQAKAVFLPSGPLPDNSAFIAQVEGVESVDGIQMEHHFSWRFYTSAVSGPPDLFLPSLGIVNVGSSPLYQSPGIEGNPPFSPNTHGPNFPPGYWGWSVESMRPPAPVIHGHNP